MLDVDLRFSRSRVPVDVHFRLQRANAGLFGASGCGKSVLLRLLAGQIRPDAGRIQLRDEVLYDSVRGIDRRGSRRVVALVDRTEALDPKLTVRDHLSVQRRRRTRTHRAFTPDEVIDLAELEQILQVRALNLSDGEYLRVVLARALLSSPDLLLLDQPLSALDERLRLRLVNGLRQAMEQHGIGIIQASHQLGELLQLSDTLIVMLNGVVVGCDTLPRLLQTGPIAVSAGLPEISNVLRVTVQAHDPLLGCTLANLFGNRLILPFMPQLAPGASYLVGVRGEEIALSLHPLLGVSIQNQIRGRVCALIPLANGVLVQVDVGVTLVAEVTQRAVVDMNLKEGHLVYCLIKAQALRFLAAEAPAAIGERLHEPVPRGIPAGALPNDATPPP